MRLARRARLPLLPRAARESCPHADILRSATGRHIGQPPQSRVAGFAPVVYSAPNRGFEFPIRSFRTERSRCRTGRWTAGQPGSSFTRAKALFPALLALLAATTVTAAPVRWTLQDVTFEDGGTAVGSFVFDADLEVFSDIAFNTTLGIFDVSGQSYSAVHPTLSAAANGGWFVIDGRPDLSFTQALLMAFQEDLTNAGGTVALHTQASLVFPNFTAELYCDFPDCRGRIARHFATGSVVGAVVPVPAAVWMLGSAPALLGVVRRRVVQQR